MSSSGIADTDIISLSRTLRAKTLREIQEVRHPKQNAILRQRLAMAGLAVLELEDLSEEEASTVRSQTSTQWLSACNAFDEGGFMENLEIALGEFYDMNSATEQQRVEAKIYELRIELLRGDTMGTVLSRAEELFELAKANSWKRIRNLAALLVLAAKVVAEQNSPVSS